MFCIYAVTDAIFNMPQHLRSSINNSTNQQKQNQQRSKKAKKDDLGNKKTLKHKS
jgi:hypothetical protein